MPNVFGPSSAGVNQASLAPLESTMTLAANRQKPGNLQGKEVTVTTDATTSAEVGQILKQATRLSADDVDNLVKANIIKDVILRQGPAGTVFFTGIKPEHQLTAEAIGVLVAIANRGISADDGDIAWVDNDLYAKSGVLAAVTYNEPYERSGIDGAIYEEIGASAVYAEVDNAQNSAYKKFAQQAKAMLGENVTIRTSKLEQGDTTVPGRLSGK